MMCLKVTCVLNKIIGEYRKGDCHLEKPAVSQKSPKIGITIVNVSSFEYFS